MPLKTLCNIYTHNLYPTLDNPIHPLISFIFTTIPILLCNNVFWSCLYIPFYLFFNFFFMHFNKNYSSLYILNKVHCLLLIVIINELIYHVFLIDITKSIFILVIVLFLFIIYIYIFKFKYSVRDAHERKLLKKWSGKQNT